jgi:pSer/pThr/pTyr-binding forkhead associated (FHA) protein
MSALLVGSWIENGKRLEATLGDTATIGTSSENTIVVQRDGVSRRHARITQHRDGHYVLEDTDSRNGTWVNGERISRTRLRHLDVITLGKDVELVFMQREAPAVTDSQRPIRPVEPPKAEEDDAPITALLVRPPPFLPPERPVQQQEGNLPETVLLGFREVGPPPSIQQDLSEHDTGTRAPTDPETVLAIGPAIDLPTVYASSNAKLTGALGEFQLSPGITTVGRAPDATVRIESREVSRLHAIITMTSNGAVVEDQGSANGTSVNGAKIVGPRQLKEGDRLAFAHFEFRVSFGR